MPLSDTFKSELQDHVFQNANVADIGDATGLRGSTTAGSLYFSLHTADPKAGNQSTSESAYTSYARQSAARSAGGFTEASGTITNAAAINFPANTGAAATQITHWGIGVGSSGATDLLWSGELIGPRIVVTVDASTDTLTSTSHGLTNGQASRVRAVDGTVPAGLSAGTQYFVVGATANTFQLSTTVGGAAVNITDAGSGTISVHKDYYITPATNVAPSIGIGQLSLSFA